MAFGQRPSQAGKQQTTQKDDDQARWHTRIAELTAYLAGAMIGDDAGEQQLGVRLSSP
ncbi:hypothetical protein ACX80V_03655 [Arthrobacter sp. MDT3-24]